MLIRDDRLNSKNDVVADAVHKRMTKVAIRSSVLMEGKKQAQADGTNEGKLFERPNAGNGKSSNSNSKSKPLGDKVRFDVSCEKKSDTKMFVISRDTTSEELLTQVRKKFNLTSASNMKKFNSFRIVVSLKGAVYEDFYDLSSIPDGTHLQICHSPLGLSLDRRLESLETEVAGQELKLEVGDSNIEEDSAPDPDPSPDTEVPSPGLHSTPTLTLNTILSTISSTPSDVGDNTLPPPPPLYIKPPPTENDLLCSRTMKDAYISLISTKNYQEILSDRCKLPIYDTKQQILSALKTNQVIVVCGETGSGKTTQLPTYVLDEMIQDGLGCDANIVCTQPRRIAAITVAERVSYERCETPSAGDTIGYQIRLQSQCGSMTKILHCTTGVLLRKILDPAYLNTVSHVIMDEVHERQVETDFLLALLKAECLKRPHLKLILMSATLQESLFSDYFGGVPVVYVSGRTHPVTNHYWHEIAALNHQSSDVINYATGSLAEYGNVNFDSVKANIKGMGGSKGKPSKIAKLMEDRENVPPIANNVHVIVETIVGIIRRGKQSKSSVAASGCKSGRSIYTPKPNSNIGSSNSRSSGNGCSSGSDSSNGETETTTCGDGILVFLSGADVIDKVEKVLKQKYGAHMKAWNAFVVTLSGSQTAQRQKMAFKVTSPGEWKIVLSTNISETSVTVPDVTHVVDSGFVKEMRYEPSTNLSSLKEVPISRASARQRAGRAGRVRPGHCWKLYSEVYHDGNSQSNIAADAPNRSIAARTIGNTASSDLNVHESNARLCMQQYSTAEIKRIPLEDVVLQILILKLGHPVIFLKSCMEVPSDAQLVTALENLISFGAILPVDGSNFALTPLGTHLARLPVDRHIGKMLIMGCLFKCIVPVLTIAAALCSSKSPFVSPPPHKRAEASEAHRKFAKSGENSDLLAIIHAYNAWVQLDNDRGNIAKFCSENYLNMNILTEMKQLRAFFRRHLEVLGFLQGEHNAQNTDDGRYGEGGDGGGSEGEVDDHDAGILGMSSSVCVDDDIVGGVKFDSASTRAGSSLNVNASVTSETSKTQNYRGKKVENLLLRCVIGSGLFPNIVRVCRSDGKGKRGGSSSRKGAGREDMRPIAVLDKHASSVFIHPSSLLSGQMNQLLIEEGGGRECIIAYHEKVATSKVFLRECTCIPTLGILLMCGRISINANRTMIIAGGGWLKYKTSSELHAVLYKKLQLEINQLLSIKLENPYANMDQQQDQLIAIVKELLL